MFQIELDFEQEQNKVFLARKELKTSIFEYHVKTQSI